MPETVPGVTFREGICNFCSSHEQEKCRGKDELDRIVADARSQNRQYDCVVPVSGGRDSTFVLYAARAVYGLKALAVNLDNEFQTDQALINLQRACKVLGVELLRVRSKRNLGKRIVASQVRLALPTGLGGIVDALCIACTYGYMSAVYRVAEQRRIPLILWGESSGEATQDMQQIAEEAWRDRHGTKRSKLRNLLRPAYYTAQYHRLLQRLEFPIPGNRVLFDEPPTLKSTVTQEIRIFDYIPWNRQEIKETITTKLGWEKPAGRISTWRTDCKLVPLVNYCYVKRFGCSKSCFGYCKMINAGQMTRDEALAQEEHTVATCSDGIERVLRNEVGLRAVDVARVLSLDY